MIVNVYDDQSEGYEYEIGDEVEITGTIHGGWFNHAIGRTGPVVEVERIRGRPSGVLQVKDLPDWGPTGCMTWQVKPTPETRATATIRTAAPRSTLTPE